MSDQDAGPSSKPMFKKRASRPDQATTSRTAAVNSPLGNGRNHSTAVADGNDNKGRPSGEDNEGEEEEDTSALALDDLVKLRTLRSKQRGVSIDLLNKGEPKKKKKKQKKPGDMDRPKTEEERWEEQMQKGGLMTRSDMRGASTQRGASNGLDGDEGDDDDDDNSDKDDASGTGKDPSKSSVNRLARQANFTEEKATVDVDKHMMAFIEEEMRKRLEAERAGHTDPGNGVPVEQMAKDSSGLLRLGAQDELYSISEKYKQIQQSARDAILQARGRAGADKGERDGGRADGGQDRENEEGNVALSTSMLTSVPEIDLGIDYRVRNIEATERARRAVEQAAEAERKKRETGGNVDDDADYASARCELFTEAWYPFPLPES